MSGHLRKFNVIYNLGDVGVGFVAFNCYKCECGASSISCLEGSSFWSSWPLLVCPRQWTCLSVNKLD